jgi:hypothetical protein
MMRKESLLEVLKTQIILDPFPHLIVDNFFEDSFANSLESEFPPFDSTNWYNYDSPIEKKRTMNSWDKFPPNTYKAVFDLCSREFAVLLSYKLGVDLYPDYGLNGGGWHMHGRGGKLNLHKDYSMHPKVPLERKFNIIIYLTKNWNPEWGGGIQFWSHDEINNKPKECVKKYDLVFNRAVIFDTTQNSWHGLPEPLSCPEGQYRKSLAIYYLQKPDVTACDRNRALFAPTKEQESDQSILKLIEDRAHINRY